MKKFRKVLQVIKKSTKTLFRAREGTISELVFFPFRKKSQEKFFVKNLRKIFFHFLKKLECSKNAVYSSQRWFMLSIFHLSVINLFFCKNLNELS